MKITHKRSPSGYYFTDMSETMFFKSIFIDEDDVNDMKRYHLIKDSDVDYEMQQIKNHFKMK